MSYDELELDKLGDEKSALFFLISDTDTTYNLSLIHIYYNDSDGIRWNSSKHGWIVAMYCNNFSEEVFHGSGYEISYYY